VPDLARSSALLLPAFSKLSLSTRSSGGPNVTDMTTTADRSASFRAPGSAPLPDRRSNAAATCAVEVVLPVYNEETDLEPSVCRLQAYLEEHFPFSYVITIADNASTDGTWPSATRLAATLPHVRATRLSQKGRGRALRAVWEHSDAAVVAYMDIDLSTDLAALLPLVAPLLSGHSDLAIGSRLARTSRVVRGARREVLSRGYNLLLRTTLRARFSDAQCGFKAIRTEYARRLLPLVRDTGWFFDTELLVLAERAGLRIHEVPVDWVDDPDSRVDIPSTVLADVAGIGRMAGALASGALPVAELRRQFGRGPLVSPVPGVPARLSRQVLRFATIGVASTFGYVVLYVLLRTALGAQAANLIALLLTAVANTSANRRLTFGISGSRHAARSQIEGLAVFGLGLALTSGALAVLHATTGAPGRGLELTVLVATNLVATVLRFFAYRIWVFSPRRHDAMQLRTEAAADFSQ
jgi:putative flippase GtrA